MCGFVFFFFFFFKLKLKKKKGGVEPPLVCDVTKIVSFSAGDRIACEIDSFPWLATSCFCDQSDYSLSRLSFPPRGLGSFRSWLSPFFPRRYFWAFDTRHGIKP